ncbi:AcrR family transcriptional regulator [Crossiella equi]|uniref:AcrR family transcriptional regulator n=1 Tax=Crossiella equi TaxID=130796 RepID=A0ABS5AQN2_9PSEU|nr:TetR/AcrR family transcriptional regulator [Crossiella equi]MBP2478000.1 AcrR family transcriptional regulator [Crossiella equi]
MSRPGHSAAPRRARNPWGQGERLRQEIIAATERLLGAQDSDDQLTIRGVARAAGIAPASIYPHFADLTELVGALMHDQLCRMVAVMTAGRDGVCESDPRGRLRGMLNAYVDFATGNPAHQRLLLTFPKGVGTSWNDVDTMGPAAEIGQLLLTSLQACEQAGHRLRVPAETAGEVVMVATFGRVVLRQASRGGDGGIAIPELVDVLLSLVFD